MTPDGELERGELFRDYRVTEVLGRGGMGVVYRVTHEFLGREAALKVIRGQRATRADAAEMMKAEARLMCLLNHPGIVRVHTANRLDDGTVFIEMELLHGITLRERIHRAAPLPPDEVCTLGILAAKALQYGHRIQIIHRDIKPENIFLTSAGLLAEILKILDYGIAKFGLIGLKSQLPGRRFGTPAYCGPEQLMGGPVGPWTDAYALAVCLYEMLTGRHPFATGPGHEGVPKGPALVLAQESRPPRPVAEFMPELAAAVPYLFEPIFRCLKKEPKERYQEMGPLIEVLGAARERYLAEREPEPTASPWPVTEPLSDGRRLAQRPAPPPVPVGLASATTESVAAGDSGGAAPPAELAAASAQGHWLDAYRYEAPNGVVLPVALVLGPPHGRHDDLAARRLRALEAKADVDLLAEARRDDVHPAVRARAAELLAACGKTGLDVVRSCVADEEHPAVRSALEAIVAGGPRGARDARGATPAPAAAKPASPPAPAVAVAVKPLPRTEPLPVMKDERRPSALPLAAPAPGPLAAPARTPLAAPAPTPLAVSTRTGSGASGGSRSRASRWVVVAGAFVGLPAGLALVLAAAGGRSSSGSDAASHEPAVSETALASATPAAPAGAPGASISPASGSASGAAADAPAANPATDVSAVGSPTSAAAPASAPAAPSPAASRTLAPSPSPPPATTGTAMPPPPSTTKTATTATKAKRPPDDVYGDPPPPKPKPTSTWIDEF
ncbi:MAG: serine/threonine protein kinase [Acidobacteria bacterium]|nr:serine/threonine protein kinase [Acidobacteriota bacterium]